MIPQALEKANLRHIETSAYCCFLPDLTRFTASYCAGPKPCIRNHQRAILMLPSNYIIFDFHRQEAYLTEAQYKIPLSSLPWHIY